MRGYHRPRADLQPLATPSKSREAVADHIAAGHPSPVSYEAVLRAPLAAGAVALVPATPVHLRRAPEQQP